jgi:2-dehydro-3-deoxy-D-arabinonate dehydratase
LIKEHPMSDALFRVELAQETRLARGTIDDGPRELLPAEVSIDGLLADRASALADALDGLPSAGPCPADARVLAPIEDQEVWCAGVSYARSRDARMEESTQPDFYDLVYDADRPELFFKANGWRVRGPGESIAVRADSGWDMAEPELGLVLAADGGIAGFVAGNDMSSRTIEGENPLYLPQAKVYEQSCSLGPAILPPTAIDAPVPIRMIIVRGGETVFDQSTSSAQLKRTFDDLSEHLFRAMPFPRGAVLLTGTGIVPDASVTVVAGDNVRIEMGPLGVLENPVVSVG